MARGAGRITRIEVRWAVLPALLGLVVLLIVIGRVVGTKVAEALTLVLLLGPILWYLATSMRGKRNADAIPPDMPFIGEVGDVPPAGDVGGDAGGCN